MYLMWFDDHRTKPIQDKIAEACAAYERKFHQPATEVLLHRAERIPDGGLAVAVRVMSYVPRATVYVGRRAEVLAPAPA